MIFILTFKMVLLSDFRELPINIECFMEDKDVSARVKREDFESICTDLFQRVNRFVLRKKDAQLVLAHTVYMRMEE